VIHVIEQAARAGNDDLDAAAQFLYLRVHAHAAIYAYAPKTGLPSHSTDCFVDLLGKLAGGGDDEVSNMPASPLHQTMQNR